MKTSSKYLSAAVLALVAVGASQTSILDQFIREKESGERYELKAYLDGARVWTVCDGKTSGVTSTTTMTKQQCDDWRKSEIGRRLAVAHRVIKQKGLPETFWAGFGSFCWNIGDTGCERSESARHINAGRRLDGCKSMLNWRYITRDGHKVDCSQPNPYCSGLWDRRNGEAELCQL